MSPEHLNHNRNINTILENFNVKFGENISTHMNRACETYKLRSTVCESLLISKNVPYFDNLADRFKNIFNKRNINLKPKQKLKCICHNIKLLKKYQ